MLRAEPDVFGPVASEPTVSRLIDALVAAGPKALTAIRSARAEVRSRVWELAGANAPAADGQVIVDIDGVLVLAHSDKQDATATWKKTFGHHPLVAFVDHSPAGSGEPVAALLRPGNVGDQDPDPMRTSLLPTDSMAAILAVQRLIRPVPPTDEESAGTNAHHAQAQRLVRARRAERRSRVSISVRSPTTQRP